MKDWEENIESKWELTEKFRHENSTCACSASPWKNKLSFAKMNSHFYLLISATVYVNQHNLSDKRYSNNITSRQDCQQPFYSCRWKSNKYENLGCPTIMRHSLVLYRTINQRKILTYPLRFDDDTIPFIVN